MSLINRVIEVWPGATPDDAERLLWEATAFPFCSEDAAIERLRDTYTRTNGNVTQAIDNAYREMDRLMAEHNAKHKDEK